MDHEKIYVEKEKEYASKGQGNLGVVLGAIGAGGWALSGGLNNLFGGGGSNGSTYQQTEIDALRSKECQDALELTRSIYESRIMAINENNASREVINREMFGLYQSQTTADFGLYKTQRDGFDVLSNRISQLEKEVAVNTAVRPYQDKLIQCEIDRAYTTSVNYTDKKTCRMLSGEIVLPNTPIIQGYGSYNPCCCAPAAK